MSGPRYAVYYCPPSDSMLYRFGCRWLGRDVVSGAALDAPDLFSIDTAQWRQATAEPRRYGFHATLKPPFRLADGRDEAGLVEDVGHLAAALSPFDAPPLALKELSGFLALQFAAPAPEMEALAAACVTGLDGYRAAPSETDLAKRRATGLTPRQEELLLRWGYPYVLEGFRFHMTLTGRLPDAERALFREALEPMVERFATQPLTIAAIALYREPAPGEPFTLIRYLPFGQG